MTHAISGRWGKNLAVRFSNEIAIQANGRDGERLEIEMDTDQIVIRRVRPRYTLEAMFTGKASAEWHAIYPGSYDWGPAVGRTIINECQWPDLDAWSASVG